VNFGGETLEEHLPRKDGEYLDQGGDPKFDNQQPTSKSTAGLGYSQNALEEKQRR
jgi:hypothetical protein